MLLVLLVFNRVFLNMSIFSILSALLVLLVFNLCFVFVLVVFFFVVLVFKGCVSSGNGTNLEKNI